MNVHYYQKNIEKELFIEKYVDIPKYRGMCNSCPYHDKNYSCKPKENEDYLMYAKCKKVSLYCMKVELSDEERNIENYEDFLNIAKDRFIEMLYKEEKKYPKAVFLNPGPCRLCEVCAKEENKSCRHRDLLRYSVSCMGVNCTDVFKNIFGIDVLWTKGNEVPPYFCFLGVMLYQ